MANTENDFTDGVEFLWDGLRGDEEGRQAAGQAYLANQETARSLGPAIQSFEDAEAVGGGKVLFGDFGTMGSGGRTGGWAPSSRASLAAPVPTAARSSRARPTWSERKARS